MQTQNQFNQTLGIPVDNWSPRQAPSTTTMHGQYCRLEALNLEAHAALLFTAFQTHNQGETWTYLPFGPFAMYEQFYVWLRENSEDKLYFTIIDLKTRLPQGLASYLDINVMHGSIEVGAIHYSKALQRTRAATEAMYLMMCRIFDEAGYRRYQWKCNALNENSRNAALRLGFQFEGIFRQTNVFKHYNRDTAWFSIIDSEWPALKIKLQKWLDPENFDKNGQQRWRLQEL